MIRRREVVAPYPLRRQESLPGGRALRCVVEFPCREVLAAEDQEDGPGEAIEAIRHTLRKRPRALPGRARAAGDREALGEQLRSEEHTSELQSLMRSSYAVFCLKK